VFFWTTIDTIAWEGGLVMRNLREQPLIDYGLHLLGIALKADLARFGTSPPGTPVQEVAWQKYEERLASSQRAPDEALTSIFSLVALDSARTPSRNQRYHRREALALHKETIFPAAREEIGSDVAGLADDFAREFQAAQTLGEAGLFERFCYLLHKYAWAIPCSYGEAGISLFEQWKTVSALVFASGALWREGPDRELTLIGGDIPGIQDFVYTITSKGAAKGLRGRSFFIQLLGDAIIQRIVAELELSTANVIYNAGGNFMVLGPSLARETGGQTTEQRLGYLQQTAQAALLDVFRGDLAMCLAWTPLRIDQVGTNEFADPVSRVLKQRIAENKRRRFAEVAREKWLPLFGAQGKPGNRYCIICQRPLGRDEGVEMEGDDIDAITGEPRRRCVACNGFKQLAERIGGKFDFLAISDQRPRDQMEDWQQALWRVSSLWYDFAMFNEQGTSSNSRLYVVNRTDFLKDSAHGFRFIANATPRVTDADLHRWDQEQQHNEGDEVRPRLGAIRTFSQMADVAIGVPRVGILRMDVDNLGQIMVRGLSSRTMAATSTLSGMMDLFFAGWLNRLCEEVNQEHRLEGGDDRGDRLYVIYAGGDDLFVVGAWDLMPILAARVHADFARFTADNPALHISAGIALEDRKFPLYQAAEHAGYAEHAAKANRRAEVTKDAISFLGVAVKWDEWPDVAARTEKICQLITGEQAPRALVQVLENVYAQYREQLKQTHERLQAELAPLPVEPDYRVQYGPWMWREAYALTRMAERVSGEAQQRIHGLRVGEPQPAREAAEEIRRLQEGMLTPLLIRHNGLAARWAELLTRKEKES
jgi:CRISPR-associated protein Csm1